MKLKNFERTEIISLHDAQASKANILGALTKLAARVQPEDAVVVFFAGHGTAQQNQFYLIPHDLGFRGERSRIDKAGLQTILAHSISDRELEKAFAGVDAGQFLLVIDACNSGQALEAEEKRRGPMNSRGLAQLAYEKGIRPALAALRNQPEPDRLLAENELARWLNAQPKPLPNVGRLSTLRISADELKKYPRSEYFRGLVESVQQRREQQEAQYSLFDKWRARWREMTQGPTPSVCVCSTSVLFHRRSPLS